MRRALWSLLAILILIGLFAAGFQLLESNRPRPSRQPTRELGPVPVRVRSLVPRPVTVEVEGFGTLRPCRVAVLAPEVGGAVARVLEPWRVGEAVAAGTLLVALDPDLLDQEVHVAQAVLEAARATLEAAEVEGEFAASGLVLFRESHELARREEERLRSLSESLDVSRSQLDAAVRARFRAAQELDSAEGRVRQATVQIGLAGRRIAEGEARLALARERRARAEITAPFDGVLTEIGPALGSYLTPGAPVASLVDVSVLRARIPIAERELALLRPGQRATVSSSSRPGELFTGRIVGIGIEADPRLRSVPVEVELDPLPLEVVSSNGADGQGPAEPPPLRPGQLVEVRLAVREVEGALVIGRDEFLWKEGRAVAFVCESPEVEGAGPERIGAREVRLGPRVEGGFLIESGLVAGELLVTGPLGRLVGGEACTRLDPPGEE